MLTITLALGFGLVPSMAIMEGFQRDLRARLRGSLADVVVRPRVQPGTAQGVAELLARAEGVAGVAAAAPRVTTHALFKTSEAYVPVVIIAVDPVREAQVSEYGRFTGQAAWTRAHELAKWRFENAYRHLHPDGRPVWRAFYAAIEKRPAAEVHARLLAERTALLDYAMPNMRADLTGLLQHLIAEFDEAAQVAAAARGRLPLPDGPFGPDDAVPVLLGIELELDLRSKSLSRGRRLHDLELLAARVDRFGRIDTEESKKPIPVDSGPVFRSGQFDLDSRHALVPIAAAWNRVVPPGAVSEIAVRVADGATLPQVEAGLAAAFPSAEVLTWMEQRKSLLRAVRLEKGFLALLLYTFVIGAGFIMLTTFYTMVRQKRRDLGLLRALGARAGGVAAIFCTASLLIGGIGTTLGILLGLAICHNMDAINDVVGIFPKHLYYMDAVPTVVELDTVLTTVAFTLGLTLVLGGLIPALVAGRLDPIKALRHE